MRCWTGAVVLAGVVGVADSGAAQTNGPAPGEIAAAWKKRQDALKTFQVKWEQKVLHPKGGYSAAAPQVFAPNEVFPLLDVTHDESASLAIDGERLRYEYRCKIYTTVTKSWTDSSFRSIYDGKTGAYLEDAKDFTYVSREVLSRPSHVNSIVSFPALAVFRPVEPKLAGIDIGSFEATGKTATLGGVVCAELLHKGFQGNNPTRVWVDGNRGWLPVRIHMTSQYGMYSSRHYDVEYSRHDKMGWAPAGWRWSAVARKGELSVSVRGTVTELVVNEAVSDATFDTTPPPGSLVVDKTSGQSQTYVLRPDGSRREMHAGELAKPFSELVATEPGGAPRLSWWERNGMRAVAALVVLLGLAGLVYLRLRPQRAALTGRKPS